MHARSARSPLVYKYIYMGKKLFNAGGGGSDTMPDKFAFAVAVANRILCSVSDAEHVMYEGEVQCRSLYRAWE